MEDEQNGSAVDMANVIATANQSSALSSAAQVYLDEQSRALAEKQLDVRKLRRECYYLLSQYSWNPGDTGVEWTKSKDERKNVLTEWGIDRVMQIIHFYINESNLLSNFSEAEIRYLMMKFLLELNDLVLLKYEFLFREPTFEECKEILMARIQDKKKVKMFAAEILGQVPNGKQIETDLYKEIETRIEYEIKKIKDEQRRQRIREYGLMVAQLEVIVLGALNRALNGEERGSLRRHTQMLEMLGGSPQAAKETGGMLRWLKGG